MSENTFRTFLMPVISWSKMCSSIIINPEIAVRPNIINCRIPFSKEGIRNIIEVANTLIILTILYLICIY